eukprot:970526-Rhodomonas_salina.3
MESRISSKFIDFVIATSLLDRNRWYTDDVAAAAVQRRTQNLAPQHAATTRPMLGQLSSESRRVRDRP